VEIRMSDEQQGGPGAKSVFADPALGRFAAAFLRLAEQHWVQQEQLMNLVALLESKGVIGADELVQSASDQEDSAARDHLLREFIARTMGPLREPG
jgi:hypothetical protein